jgi:hypothetical protein
MYIDKTDEPIRRIEGKRLWAKERLIVNKNGDNLPALFYFADSAIVSKTYFHKQNAIALLKSKSISVDLMPKWASRITLKVENATTRYVQDISSEDILEEGIVWDSPSVSFPVPDYETFLKIDEMRAKNAYSTLWDKMCRYANLQKDYYEHNPLVVSILFDPEIG